MDMDMHMVSDSKEGLYPLVSVTGEDNLTLLKRRGRLS
jgi:hypothetical protein